MTTRPKDDVTADGRKIVYPLWRDDIVEATILPVKANEDNRTNIQTQHPVQ